MFFPEVLPLARILPHICRGYSKWSGHVLLFHALHASRKRNLLSSQSYIQTSTIIKPPINRPTLHRILLTPILGLSFCATSVAVEEIEVQLAVPHCQPLRQQFPPRLAAQLDQPEAQFPDGVATVAAEPTGTTTVTPLLMIVVELTAGQSVVSQSLPVLQHPPA